jgi:hypothetical protein
MAEQKVTEAAQALLKSFRETNQLITESIASTQERSTHFAQNFFQEGLELLKANQEVAEKIVNTQERNTQFAQSFFNEALELLKTNQAVMQSIGANQERNVKFFQSFFTEGMEAFKSQAESTRTLMQEKPGSSKKLSSD